MSATATDDAPDDPDLATRAKDVLTEAVFQWHKWLVGGFFALTFWHAYTSPELAISSRTAEIVFALIALGVLVSGVKVTADRADTI